MEQHDHHVWTWRIHYVMARWPKTLAYLAKH